jgi:plastocyanin
MWNTRGGLGRLTAAVAASLGIPLVLTLLVACGPTDPPEGIGNVVTIPRGQSLLAPFILVTEPHAAIIWRNDDAQAHTLTTTPAHSAYLNPTPFTLSVPAGGEAHLALAKPGLYDYYDANVATWNADDQRVAAQRGVPHYPLAMEGIIWVRGAIGGLPTAVTQPIPAKDEFASPFLAIQEGGTVTWYNADTDQHVITLVPGWSDPINPGQMDAVVLDGTVDAPPNGATLAVTFDTPGLYYYYCSAHATIQPTWHRAMALSTASEAPIPMEGFLLVLAS